MEKEKKEKTNFERSLSKLQMSVNHYIEALSKFSEAIEIRKEEGLIDEKGAILLKETLHRNMISLNEIQQLIIRKTRYHIGYFPIFQNQNLSFTDIGDWDLFDLDIDLFTREEAISNYLSYHRKKVPLTYPEVTLKRAEPKKPWLAPIVCSENNE